MALGPERKPNPNKARRGKANGRTRFTSLDRRAMREMHAAGAAIREIARRMGCSRKLVSRYVRQEVG